MKRIKICCTMNLKISSSFIVKITFTILILLIILLTNCIRDKSILSFEYPDEQPCDDEDTIRVWKHLGLDGENVTAIAVHPQKPHVIFAGTSGSFSDGIPGRLFLSTDCGRTWRKILEGSFFKFTDIKFDHRNPDIVYAVPFPIIKSNDGGLHWREISNGMRLDWETRVSEIAIHPFNSKILCAGTGGFMGGSIYKSTNTGRTWTNLVRKDSINNPGMSDILRLTSGVVSIAIDPYNPDIIYVSTAQTGDVFKSTDGGKPGA